MCVTFYQEFVDGYGGVMIEQDDFWMGKKDVTVGLMVSFFLIFNIVNSTRPESARRKPK